MPTTIEHKKATRGHTSELARYIANPKKMDREWGDKGVHYTNLGRCPTIEKAIEKLLEVQAEAKLTCRDVNYHLIIAFEPKSTISHAIFRDSEKICVEALGLQKHQRLSVIHTNTDSPHLHIHINRVHPIEKTQEGYLRLNNLAHSQRKLKSARAYLEEKHHLTRTTRREDGQKRSKIFTRSTSKESLGPLGTAEKITQPVECRKRQPIKASLIPLKENLSVDGAEIMKNRPTLRRSRSR